MFESDLVLNDDASVEIRVEIDSGDLPDVRLAMEFPASYPAQMAPSFSVRSTVKLSPSEVEFVHSSLTGLFEPGEPVVYEWVLWLQDNAPSLPSFQRESDSIRGALAAVADAESLEVKANKLSTTVADEPEIDNQSNGAEEPRSERTVRTKEGPVGVADCGIEIYHGAILFPSSAYLCSPFVKECMIDLLRAGPTFTDRKSVFQAHLAAVESTQDVRRVMAVRRPIARWGPARLRFLILFKLQALLQDRKLQRATHNISAYVSRRRCEFTCVVP